MNEKMIVEIEVKAKEVLSEFERLDAQFQETAAGNKRLYQLMWKEHREYVKNAERETKQRAVDEKWLTRELEKEEGKRKRAIRQDGHSSFHPRPLMPHAMWRC